jgi:hypothetical protein
MAAQGVGQDWVTLLVGVPSLLLSLVALRRGSRMGMLIFGGALFYFLYSFLIYAFGLHFNRLFLLYCAVLGMSLYAFVLYLVGMSRVPVATWFVGAPVRLVAGYLVVVALLFYGLWLSSVLPAVARDTVPADVRDYALLVNPVHVIDMAVALPGLLVAAAMIRKHRDLGYVLASVALIFMMLLCLALAGMVVLVVHRGISEDFTVAIVFAAQPPPQRTRTVPNAPPPGGRGRTTCNLTRPPSAGAPKKTTPQPTAGLKARAGGRCRSGRAGPG